MAILLTTCMCLSLVACGGSDSDQSSSGDDSSGSSDMTQLKVVTTFAGNDGNAQNYKDGVAAWEKQTGNEVKDNSGTSDETFKARVITDFEVGAEPDVLFYFNGNDSDALVKGEKVVSVDEIRAEYPDYATNMKDDMLGASPVDGKNYSIPVNGYWEAMYVNKKVLEDAGVAIPGPDYTWDEFLADCKTIQEAGYTPIAAALAEVPHYWFEYTIYNYQTPATHCTLPEAIDDQYGQAWVDGINDIKALYEDGYFPKNTNSVTDAETFQMFVDGKAAFLLDGSWKAGGIAEATDDIDNFTVTYCPGKNDRKATDLIGGLSSGYYISRKAWDDPDKREAAVSFIEYMTSDEMVSKFAATSATALKNGVEIDESKLDTLQKDCIKLTAGATGISPAVQDLVPQEYRVPIFDGMPKLVTGDEKIETAVETVINSLNQ